MEVSFNKVLPPNQKTCVKSLFLAEPARETSHKITQQCLHSESCQHSVPLSALLFLFFIMANIVGPPRAPACLTCWFKTWIKFDNSGEVRVYFYQFVKWQMFFYSFKQKFCEIWELTAPASNDLAREGSREPGNNYTILSQVPTANQYIDLAMGDSLAVT